MKMTAQQLADRLEAMGRYESIQVRIHNETSWKDAEVGFVLKGGSRYMWLYEADGQMWFDHVYSVNTGRVSRRMLPHYNVLKAIGYFDPENG